MIASVVLPVLDAGATIVDQLDGLAAQTFTGEWELLVVDNGSSDDTVEKVRIHPLAPQVVDATEQRSSAWARNAGARRASGRFLLFCDADDIVAPDWVSAMVAALEISELVTGPLEFRRLNASLPATLMDGFGTGAPPLAYGFLPYGLTCNLGIRKDLFEALGGFNPEFTRAYDLELCWRAQLGGHDLNFEPDAVVHRRMAPGLKGYWGRQIRDARMAPLLFRSFEAAGMRRSSTVRAVAEWIVLALRSVELALPKRRWRWIAQVSHRLGRLRGSIRYRVLYL